jgi:SAM-dependent methyltransferase
MSLNWNEWNEKTGGPKYPHEKIIQFCFRTYRPEERSRIRALDLGCGSGVHCVFLAMEGFQVTGIDASPAGIANAQKRLAEFGLQAELRVEGIEVLDFPENHFDLVICTSVLDSAGPAIAQQTLTRLLHVMRSGARGLFMFASDRDFRVTGENPYQIYGYNQNEVEHLFGQGFSQVWIDYTMTTYQGGAIEQNDWLVTVER